MSEKREDAPLRPLPSVSTPLLRADVEAAERKRRVIVSVSITAVVAGIVAFVVLRPPTPEAAPPASAAAAPHYIPPESLNWNPDGPSPSRTPPRWWSPDALLPPRRPPETRRCTPPPRCAARPASGPHGIPPGARDGRARGRRLRAHRGRRARGAGLPALPGRRPAVLRARRSGEAGALRVPPEPHRIRGGHPRRRRHLERAAPAARDRAPPARSGRAGAHEPSARRSPASGSRPRSWACSSRSSTAR
jgi:hypothetical protein